MEKTLNIGGKEVTFKSSAAIPRLYRLKFRRDIYVDMNALIKDFQKNEKRMKQEQAEAEAQGIAYDPQSEMPIESLEIFENLAYIFAKHADPNVPNTIDEWLEQFECFDIYGVLPEILELWNIENETMSVPKKVQKQ